MSLSNVTITANNKMSEIRKIRSDKATHIISSSLSWLFSLVFIGLIAFIIYASIPGFKAYGLKNILFTSTFDLSKNQASIWLPLCVTILTAGIAILIAGPIGVKSAIFIKFRVPAKFKKPLRVAIELLADIPSVIFGLFASEALGNIVGAIFGAEASYSIITASLMLTFMILPTIVSLSLNALDGLDNTLLNCAMALGNTKTRAIYKVCKRDCRNGITVGIIIAISRAIGETMAISMILQSQLYNNTFNAGFWSVLTSGLRSLGALISANMFAEGGGPALQGLLFAFGIVMFIFVIILNAIAMRLTKKKIQKKYSWANNIINSIGNFFAFIPNGIKTGREKLTYHSKIDPKNLSKYIVTRTKNNKFIKIYDWWKIFWEYFSIILTLVFLVWIIGDVLINGGISLSTQYSSVFSFVKDTTGQAFINTLLIIVIAIGIGFPLSLLIAIYINEFAKEGRLKRILLFFIDSLGATPSILFGMFGLIFFIQTLGITNQGTAGKSLIAGTLTILIVILPTFIRTIQQALQSVPIEWRENSYALGAGKWETICKIVLPAAFQGIMTSVVLSIGRILAETAPLYLTSGLASSSSINLGSEGQTLTTRIYAQIYESNIDKAFSIMYECAFITMILVLLIILVVHVLIPWYFRHKQKKEEDRYTAIKNINMRKNQELENKNNSIKLIDSKTNKIILHKAFFNLILKIPFNWIKNKNYNLRRYVVNIKTRRLKYGHW